MLVRAAIALVLSALLMGAACVYDAASANDEANALGLAAAHTSAPAAARAMLANGQRRLANAWSKPLLWHAGALETASWLSALEARLTKDPAALQQSADLARQSVARAPVQPIAWMRLAALAGAGARIRLCAPQSCLARSWASAPMLPAALACDRLTIADQARMRMGSAGFPVRAYLAARPAPRDAARCLSFLEAPDLFAALMALRRQAARDADQR